MVEDAFNAQKGMYRMRTGNALSYLFDAFHMTCQPEDVSPVIGFSVWNLTDALTLTAFVLMERIVYNAEESSRWMIKEFASPADASNFSMGNVRDA